MARTNLLRDPNADVEFLLDEAINVDPSFGEAYLERAKVKIAKNNLDGAIIDLQSADQRLPNSPLVYYQLARTYRARGEDELALNAAQRANELDVTLLPVYLLLAEIYVDNSSLPNRALSSRLTQLRIDHIDLYDAFVASSSQTRLYKPR